MSKKIENELIKINKVPYRFHVVREAAEIEKLDNYLPEDEVRKYISLGGFSSIGFVKFIAERTHIKELIISTLRVGNKHLTALDVLKKQGKLEKIVFICGAISKASNSEKNYNYYQRFLEVCEKNNWEIILYNNHSKILLFDTENGKFVIETFSNLNENPKMEQFSFEKNEELFDFYKSAFLKLKDL